MAYCDTNILTAFVNKEELGKNFGGKGIRGYPNITGKRDKIAEERLRGLKRCRISKKALLGDLRGHQASMGAILTSSGLKNVEFIDGDGFKRGKKIFNEACDSKDNSLNRFKKNFCHFRKLKNNLKRNQIEDIRHFGSSINEDIFLTGDRDLDSLNKFFRRKKRKDL